jgi:hypothetical protein
MYVHIPVKLHDYWLIKSNLQTQYLEKDTSKCKCLVCVVQPPIESRIPASFWEAQLKGTRAIIESGRCTNIGNSLLNIGYSFFEAEMGALHSRCPMFKVCVIPIPDWELNSHSICITEPITSW